MTPIDWILVVAVWLLIPAVLVMKLVMDKRQLRSEREMWEKVDRILNRKEPT